MIKGLTQIPGNAWRYFRNNGMRHTFLRGKDEIKWRLTRSLKDRTYVGKLVELCGNKWRLDGCTFYLDNPEIQTRLKSRFVCGLYEEKERYLVKSHVDRSLATVELGASIGGVSCITNKLLVYPEKHIVVEANPLLIDTLKKNRDINECKFDIMHAALAYDSDKIVFYLHERFVGGSAQRQTERSVTVPSVTLGGILDKTGFDRINLVCDIEGAEVELIEHEAGVMSAHVAIAIIEVHPDMISSREETERAHVKLLNIGFEEIERRGIVRSYRNTKI